jgi:hypothetical protein
MTEMLLNGVPYFYKASTNDTRKHKNERGLEYLTQFSPICWETLLMQRVGRMTTWWKTAEPHATVLAELETVILYLCNQPNKV